MNTVDQLDGHSQARYVCVGCGENRRAFGYTGRDEEGHRAPLCGECYVRGLCDERFRVEVEGAASVGYALPAIREGFARLGLPMPDPVMLGNRAQRRAAERELRRQQRAGR